ncbi:DUF5050 domain-containing protein [Pontimicrobium aquaticum]|uniref:DUF5050 domain-containing protein n=1 Tax=Pontimicrobium aquaticum TaxID=2565367 RepID=A0A4U0F0P5_9FLAO|nr:DUF5050 domain-containing protein [Pontimicrobium aquaticum]TJY37790.1 DUF5050 domain-containing protein [Pontimicrobium aquaticum]
MKKIIYIFLILLLTLQSSIVIAQTPNDYSAVMSNDEKKIVFYSYRPGKGKIFTMNPDGSNQQILSVGDGTHIQPIWSPDGKRILYSQSSLQDANGKRISGPIISMKADGSDVKELTNFKDGEYSGAIAWTKDKIYFTHDGDGIYTMNLDGSGQKLVKRTPNPNRTIVSKDLKKAYYILNHEDNTSSIYEVDMMNGGQPKELIRNPNKHFLIAISPDNKKIAFTSNMKGNYELYIMDSTGKNMKRLTNTDRDEYFVSFTPDSKRILFDSEKRGSADVFIMNIDGTNEKNLTRTSTSNTNPMVVGNKIVFTSRRDGNTEIYTRNKKDGKLKRLTNNSYVDDRPVLSGDGKFIAFESNRSGNSEIYIMKTDGSRVRKLTNSIK